MHTIVALSSCSFYRLCVCVWNVEHAGSFCGFLLSLVDVACLKVGGMKELDDSCLSMSDHGGCFTPGSTEISFTLAWFVFRLPRRSSPFSMKFPVTLAT